MPHGAVPFPFGLCRICNDNATGFHYGVATCEGCKGFFKRSIPKGDKYTCFFGGQCNITPFNRNRCKACRFKRCLDNGMAIDAVKMGRIPKVEKERALIEAGIQPNHRNSMDVDTEETLSNPELDHSNWIDSDLGQNPQMLRMPNDSSSCKQSFGVNVLTSHCTENLSLGLRMCPPAPEWKNKDETELSPNYSSQQPAFQSPEPSFGSSTACLQTSSRTWTSGSLKTHENALLETPSSVDDKMSTLSSLALRSSSSTFFNNQFSSEAEEDCLLSSCKSQLSTSLENNAAGNILFSNLHTSVDNSVFDIAEVKIEPEINDYGSFCNKKTVHCDNPFAQPSVSFKCQGIRDYDFLAPSAGMTRVFDSENNIFTEIQVENKCSMENVLGEISDANMRHQGSSCEMFGYTKPTLCESDVSNTSRKGRHHCKTDNSRKSCYSPDVIKVLMDQVGEERIKGMKQQIMTTLAKTFGPDEYEDTAQLLKSYTPSSGQQTNLPSDSPHQRHNSGQHNGSSNSECSETFDFGSYLDSDTQHSNLQGVQNLPSSSMMSLSMHHPSEISSLATSFHHTLTDPSHNLSQLPPKCTEYKTEHSSRLSFSCSGQKTSQLLDGVTDMELSNELNSTHYSDTALVAENFAPHEVEGFCGHNPANTGDTCFISSACPSADLNRQLFDTGIVRSLDKASVSSSSQNSGSEKSNSSPDSSSFGDLTMIESALTLSATYEKHMSLISKKYDRMMDYIQNKKVVPMHPLTPEGKAKVYNNLISSIPSINKCIIGFSQDVPGFALLPKEDKEILMKRGYYDIWMLTSSKLFHGDESYLQFEDGTFYTRALMEIILNVSIVQKLIAFAKKFNGLQLSDLEVAILCAIQLTSAINEQMDLKCHENIQQMNSHFVDLLVHEVSKQHPTNCSRTLVDIFRLIPDLAEINMLQREIIANFSTSAPPEKVEYKPKEVPMADISDTDLEALADS